MPCDRVRDFRLSRHAAGLAEIGYVLRSLGGLLFAAGGLVVLFKSVAFAWNGVPAFWMVAVLFGAWYVVMIWQRLATTNAQLAEGSPEPALA